MVDLVADLGYRPCRTVHGLRAAIDELDRSSADAGLDVQVSIRRPSLDDVFLAITAGAEASTPELMETR